MGVALSTAGVQICYAVETTAGTRPATGYTGLPDFKAVPELNPEPNALETTDLSQTEYKTYIAGLKDLGGALGFTANLTKELITAWGTVMTAYETAKKANKGMWFQIIHPDLDDAVFFSGQPSALGLPEIGVDAVLETTVYVTPVSAPVWEAKVEPGASTGS